MLLLQWPFGVRLRRWVSKLLGLCRLVAGVCLPTSLRFKLLPACYSCWFAAPAMGFSVGVVTVGITMKMILFVCMYSQRVVSSGELARGALE